MHSGIETARSVTGFFILHQEVQKTIQEQGGILAIVDPIQSKINAFIKSKTDHLFRHSSKTHDQLEQRTTSTLISVVIITALIAVVPHFLHTPLAICALFFSIFGAHRVLLSADRLMRGMYQFTKAYCFSRSFPTTRSLVHQLEYLETTTSVVISMLDQFSKQDRLLRSAEIGLVTAAMALNLSSITSDISTIFIVPGILFVILKNHSIFLLGVKDCQRCVQNSISFFKRCDEIEVKIESIRKSLIDTLYFNRVTRYVTKHIYGTKEKMEWRSSELVKNTIFLKIDNYKKRVCVYLASRIIDEITGIVLQISTARAFRMAFADFTGLGLTTGVYWISSFTLRLFNEQCRFSTPLEYTHNRVFPLYLAHQFPEECDFYESVLTTGSLIKWAILLIIWERRIRSWGRKREHALQDLFTSLKSSGKKQLEKGFKRCFCAATRIAEIGPKVLNMMIKNS